MLQAEDFPVVLGRIRIEADGVSSPAWVKRKLGLKRGQEIVKQDIEGALERLRNAGRYTALSYHLEPGAKGRQNLVIKLVVDQGYRLESGQYIVIDQININGNWKTNRKVFLNDFLFKEGERVDAGMIEESIQRVYNREIFIEVDWGLYDEDSRTIMELRVREKWTLAPLISFQGDSFSKRTVMLLGALDGNFLGQGSFIMANLVGTYVENEAPKHDIQLRYIHRRIGGIPLGVKAKAGTLNQLSYISKNGARVDAFSQSGAYVETKWTYEWKKNWQTSLILNYYYDQFSQDDVVTLGFQGYQLTQSTPGFGLGVGLDNIDSKDQRRQGYMGEASVTLWTPFQDSIYWQFQAQAQYHAIFAKDWLALLSQLQFAYSSSAHTMYQINQEQYLRGGSSREYYAPLMFGVNLELSAAPIRQKWLFLEVGAFFDLSWYGAGFADSFQTMPRFHTGPALRISFPFLGGLVLSLDFPFNESGMVSLYFSMRRYF